MVELYVIGNGNDTYSIGINCSIHNMYVHISIRVVSFLHPCCNLIEARLLKRGGNIWTRTSATDDSTIDSIDV